MTAPLHTLTRKQQKAQREKTKAYKAKYFEKPNKREQAREYAAEYRKTHEVKRYTPEQMSAYRRSHPEEYRKYRRRWTYGISDHEYDRLVEKHAGKCGVCGRRRKRLVIDHCHRTSKVRGLLCHRCNIAVGYYENAQLKKQAREYLNKKR